MLLKIFSVPSNIWNMSKNSARWAEAAGTGKSDSREAGREGKESGNGKNKLFWSKKKGRKKSRNGEQLFSPNDLIFPRWESRRPPCPPIQWTLNRYYVIIFDALTVHYIPVWCPPVLAVFLWLVAGTFQFGFLGFLCHLIFSVTWHSRSDGSYWLDVSWLDWCDPGEWWYL